MSPVLKALIQEFAVAHPKLATRTGARNRCADASIWFLEHLGLDREDWHVYMRQGEVCGEEHHWVCVEGYHIDWTARQYDPDAPFPKVWRGDMPQKKMRTVYMCMEVTFDPEKTDAEAVSNALDHLLETAINTPGITDDYGPIIVGGLIPDDPEA